MSVRWGSTCAILACCLAAGCARDRALPAPGPSAAYSPPLPEAAPAQPGSVQPAGAAPRGRVLLTSFDNVALTVAAPQAPSELVLSQYLQAVTARNQSLQAMIATWQAANERYPQAIALDDPTFNGMTAPASWRSSQVTPAYVAGGSQKLPWPGKRKLRGQMAKSDADAAFMDVAEARLQLIQAAQLAYFEYYLVSRQLELNTLNTHSLEEFRDTARRQYEANLVMQQDVLQAEVELADLARRQVELGRMQRVAIARLNTLMHLPPDSPLPAAPASLPAVLSAAPVETLRAVAIERRPDLAAIGARIEADRATLALAYKEFFPDLEVFGRYDSFWQPDTQRDLRTQVGVNMNVPIYLEKRRAAAREAMFKLNQRQAAYQQRIDDINAEVQSAYEQLQEMRQIVDLYASRTLPAARQSVESARADYVAGRGDFLRLVAGERRLIELLDQHQQAIAALHSRWADLERAVGGPVPGGREAETAGNEQPPVR